MVDRVIALTRLEADRVRRAYWIPGRKLGIIGWGATPPESPRLPSGENNLSDSSSPAGARGDSQGKDDTVPLTILCVGRLGRHKGQAWLLDIYQQAKSQFNRLARLVLVGRDEGDEASIVEEISTRGLDGEVLLTGEVSDAELTEWYARSDLFVLFSQYEAFGLVYFEAMAHRVPVLTHDVGANRELLVRGAEVIARFDTQAAVEALARLVNDAGYRAQLGQDAQEYALAEFTWSAVAEKYLREYSRPEYGNRQTK